MLLFRAAHGLATITLLCITAYILILPPPEPEPCPTAAAAPCPNHCSFQGACVNGRCNCRPGRVGIDCGGQECPGGCAGQGRCIKGTCVCNSRYGGEDCSVDRLEVMRTELLSGIDFDLHLGEKCHFVTREEAEKGGGNIIYAGEKNKMYHVPAEMRALLPDSCPTERWRTCAIIGNSGSLSFGNFGPEIDKHDMIYRFNQAPTEGFEEFVGRRTTFESLNAKFAHELQSDDPEWLWRDPRASYLFFEPLKLKETYIDIRKRRSGIQAYMFSPALAYQAHRIYDRLQENLQASGMGCFSGEKPMSGFYAVLYALIVCDQVDLYGFDAWTDDMAGKFKMRYHYFDSDEPRPGAHSFDLTFFMYRLLEMSDEYPVRLRLVEVPDDADFGARHGGHAEDHEPLMVDPEDLARDIE